MESKEQLLQIAEVEITYKKKKKGTVKITKSEDIEKALRIIWADDMNLRERFYAVFLNRQNNIIAIQEISAGGTTSCIVDAKFIFASAVKLMAESIILAHNHPSGERKQSQQDIQVTQRIKEICKLFDMSLLDHIIMTEDNYLSFADEGLI